MFTRLELREILNHLNTQTCDEEVVAKLRGLAGAKQLPSTQTDDGGWVMARAMQRNADRRAQEDQPIDLVMEHPTIKNMRREDYSHLRDDEFLGLVESRKQSIQQDLKKAGQIPMNAMAPPELHDRRLQTKIAPGEKNSAGDKCVFISADGFSVFSCPNGHGYMDTNPTAAIGCGECAMQGNTQATQQDRQTSAGGEDRGAIPGEDSKW
jgi:hypothetical protein